MVDSDFTRKALPKGSTERLKECLGFTVIFISLHPADATEQWHKLKGKHNFLFAICTLGLFGMTDHRFLGSPGPFH